MITKVFIPVMHLSELVAAFKSTSPVAEVNARIKYGDESEEKLNGLLNHGGKVIFSSIMTIDLHDYYVFMVHTADQGLEDF